MNVDHAEMLKRALDRHAAGLEDEGRESTGVETLLLILWNIPMQVYLYWVAQLIWGWYLPWPVPSKVQFMVVALFYALLFGSRKVKETTAKEDGKLAVGMFVFPTLILFQAWLFK